MEIFYEIKQFSILNGRGGFLFWYPLPYTIQIISKQGRGIFPPKNFVFPKFITIFASHTVVVLKIIIMNFLDYILEGSRMARDARIGAIGAEPIRQLY